MRSWIVVVLIAAATVVTVVSVFAVMSDASQEPDAGEQFEEPTDDIVDPGSMAAAPVTSTAPDLWDLVQAELVGRGALSSTLVEEMVVEPVDEHELRWQRLRADRDRDSWAALAVPLGLALGDRTLEPPAPAAFWDAGAGVVAVVEGAEGLDAERQLLAALTAGAIAPLAGAPADGLDDVRLGRAAATEGVLGWLDERWLDGLDDDERAVVLDDPATIPGAGSVTDQLRRSGVGLLVALAVEADDAQDGGSGLGDGGPDDAEEDDAGDDAEGDDAGDDPDRTPLERLLAEPPASTEQALDPIRYLEREAPTVVPAPAASGEVVSSGVLGQLLLRRALSARVDPYDVVAAVEGWEGDRFVTWTDDAAGSCVAVRIRSDSFVGRELLLDALDEWSTSMSDVTVERVGDRDVDIVSCARLSR